VARPDFTYLATVRRVVDGDTIDFDVDLGFGVGARIRTRIVGVDAPETRRGDPAERERGRQATAFVEQFVLEFGPDFVIKTRKADGFGRWLAEVVGFDPAGDPVNLTERLLTTGHAVPYERTR